MNPLRCHASCPDCGLVLADFNKVNAAGHPFDCPRCAAHYPHEDFWNEQEQKRMAQYPKLARADLSGEERE